VLWRAVIAVCEGIHESARGLAEEISTINSLPNGVGVGVPVCWSGGRKVFASLGRV
jgi:hypothetical protein